MAVELHYKIKNKKYALYSTISDEYITPWDTKNVIREYWIKLKTDQAIRQVDEWMEDVDKII